jgi:hypothetical protein
MILYEPNKSLKIGSIAFASLEIEGHLFHLPCEILNVRWDSVEICLLAEPERTCIWVEKARIFHRNVTSSSHF